MRKLSSNELKSLDIAVTLGILSPTNHAEAIAWYLDERDYRRDQPSPIRPRLITEINAAKLTVDIALREFLMCQSEKAGPVRDLNLMLCQVRLDKYKLNLANITANRHFVESKKKIDLNLPKKSESTMPQQAQEALKLVGELESIQFNLGSITTPVHLIAKHVMTKVDAELCLKWSNISMDRRSSDDDQVWEILKRIDVFRRCQLLSARTAELLMQSYYRNLNFEVEDVSLQQIEPANDDWKFFDLRVGEVSVDVKNARKSLHGEGHFVEHCVPKFKTNRTTGEHVIIAGVLSDYLADPKKYIDELQSATVLGEVTVQDVRILYRWARHRFGAQLDLIGIWDVGFLPGWIFEYRDEHYPIRRKTMDAITPLTSRLVTAGSIGENLPGWLLVLCKDDALVSSLPLEGVKRKILDDLRQMAKDIGLTRRSIYVYAIGLALESFIEKKSPADNLNMLWNLLSVKAKDHSEQTILGLADPIGYVLYIIQTLIKIGSKLIESDIQVVGFRLTHPAILKGVCADGTQMTLLAYCGGWQEHPFPAKCGTTPLSIADNQSCKSCGYLICHNCSQCSDHCALCKPRQYKQAMARLPMLLQ